MALNGITTILGDITQAYQVYRSNPLIKVQWETFAAVFGGEQFPQDTKNKDKLLKMLSYATYVEGK